MSVTVEIPFSPQIPQRFSISLAGVIYNIKTSWNVFTSCWVIDISDINNNLLIGGIALVTGVDLLQQFAYIGIGGQLLVWPTVPQWNNLGTTSHVFFVTP